MSSALPRSRVLLNLHVPRLWHPQSLSLGLRRATTLSSAIPKKSPFYLGYGLAFLGLGFMGHTNMVYCEGGSPKVTTIPLAPDTDAKAPADASEDKDLPPSPSSIVSTYELSFGTVAGICTGIFVKKGAKIIAFAVGGVFVLLQYLSSLSYIKIDWKRIETRFADLFYTADQKGLRRAPSVGDVWSRLVHFLTADFQQRASFCVGLALGLRIG